MHTIAEEWEATAQLLADAVNADRESERRTALSEAAGALNDIARQETQFFKHARDEF